MRVVWRELADLALPAGCAGCGAPRARGGLCAACGGMLAGARAWRVRPGPAAAGSGLPPVHSAVVYADEARSVLLAHKERGALQLARPLGELLARSVRHAVPDRGARRLALVPVPSARRAVAGRGHDPVRRIARAAAGVLRREGARAQVVPVLRQCRPVADQSGLTAGQRSVNLLGALEAPPGAERLLARSEVVLVDDLVTTGASLAEAARAVRSRAGPVRAAAVVAARLSNGR